MELTDPLLPDMSVTAGRGLDERMYGVVKALFRDDDDRDVRVSIVLRPKALRALAMLQLRVAALIESGNLGGEPPSLKVIEGGRPVDRVLP